MKTILDSRVRRVGTTEPTLNTASYGDETHIIVQIPTPSSHDKLDPVERRRKDAEFIAEAKSVIGQVIKIQFKEPRPENEFQDLLQKRGTVNNAIAASFNSKTIPFDAWSQKIADSYENVFSLKSAEIQALVGKNNMTLADISSLIPLSGVKLGGKTFAGRVDGVTLGTRKGIGFVAIEGLDSKPLSEASPVDVKMLFVDSEPLRFRPALGANGDILDEKHLINTIPTPDPTTGQYVVSLVFDSE